MGLLLSLAEVVGGRRGGLSNVGGRWCGRKPDKPEGGAGASVWGKRWAGGVLWRENDKENNTNLRFLCGLAVLYTAGDGAKS